MNKELMEAMTVLEKEYNITKTHCWRPSRIPFLRHVIAFGEADGVEGDDYCRGCDYSVYAEKEVVEIVEDPVTQISLADARNEVEP